jgi:hypothetical protein
VEKTIEPVTPVHTVPVHADDGWSGRWIRRFQMKRSVGAVGVVVRDVDPKHLRQVPTPHDQQPVQALGPHRADPPLREGVRVWCLDWRHEHVDTLRPEHLVEPAVELRVPIADKKAQPAAPLAQHQQQVAAC